MSRDPAIRHRGAARVKRSGWLSRHGPFLLLVGFLFVLAFYVDWYLGAFTYILLNSRLFFQIFVGITVIAVLRNVVGIRGFGTFGPAIVALAFLQAGLLYGTILLANILAIVIATRELVRRELVQRDHRIAILVILVGLSVVLLEILAEYFHYPRLDYSFLFPVLILAWTAERYVESIDRVGWGGPSRQLLWTFVAILTAYAVMSQTWLVDPIILTPLSWPFLVLLNWFLGTRVRFRLSERRRFRGTIRDSGTPPEDVLTMNVRNRDFISKYNDRGLLATLAKDRVKELLASYGVRTPQTHLVVAGLEDLHRLEGFLPTMDRFVLKPASGHGGEGILIVRGRRDGGFDTSQGPMSPAEILAHARYVLTGAFGRGSSDRLLVEALVTSDPALGKFVSEGLPDVRVIAFLGFPVMAMTRLPTRESKGRANIHAGAVACGLEIATGRIVRATWHGRPVKTHPDTGLPLLDALIPRWFEVLEMATQAQVCSGLGYAGVDLVFDAARGPMVLEVNRRPGLEIQNANGAGLLGRLRAIERVHSRGAVADPVRAAMDLDIARWRVSA